MKRTMWIGVVVIVVVALVLGAALWSMYLAPPSVGVKRVRLLCTEAGDPAALQFWTSQVKEFNKMHPDIEVIDEYVGWEDAYVKIAAGVEAGTPPDILFTSPFYGGLLYEQQLLAPVTDVIKDLGWQGDLLAPSRFVVDGEDYFLPVQGELRLLYYRKDWAQEKNIEFPVKSWDELLKAAEAFNDPGEGRYGMAMPLKRTSATTEYLGVYYKMTGQHWYNEDGSVGIDNQEFRDFLEFLKELYKYTPPDAIEWAWGDIRTAFKVGKCGMSTYEARTFVEIFGEDFGGYGSGYPELIDVFGVQPYPPQRAEDWPDKITGFGGFEGFMIIKGSPYADEAKEFMKFYLGSEDRYITHLYTVPFHESPVLRSVVEGTKFWDHPIIQRRPDLAPILKEIYLKGVMTDLDWYPDRSPPLVVKSARVAGSLAITDAIIDYLVGDKPLEQVVAAARETLEEA